MRDDPFATFRPRRARVVAGGAGIAAVVIFLVLGLVLYGQWRVADRLGIIAIGVAVGLVCWRFASIRAVPDREGVTVRNLFVTRTVPWSEVVRVEFGGGPPWATLHLQDGDAVAVMAVQRADGPSADVEASRLAGLVEALR
jgi:hypothetical protein